MVILAVDIANSKWDNTKEARDLKECLMVPAANLVNLANLDPAEWFKKADSHTKVLYPPCSTKEVADILIILNTDLNRAIIQAVVEVFTKKPALHHTAIILNLSSTLMAKASLCILKDIDHILKVKVATWVVAVVVDQACIQV